MIASNEEKLALVQAQELSTATRALAYAVLEKYPNAEDDFTLFIDYLIAQKAIERIVFRYSNYQAVRKIPADFLSALSVCDDTRKLQLIGEVKSLLEFEQLYLSSSQLAPRINSDYIYNVPPHFPNQLQFSGIVTNR